MKSLFLVVLLCAVTGMPQLYAAESYQGPKDTKPCKSEGRLAMFGVDGRYEDYLRGCFPCCFCCGDDGDCCDECKGKNTLVAPQAPNED